MISCSQRSAIWLQPVTSFGKQANGVPDRVEIDKGGSNKAGLKMMNDFLYLVGIPMRIKIIKAKYLNNIIEQTSRDLLCNRNARRD